MRDFSQLLKIFILALVVGIGLNFVTAWTPPTVAPPGGNSATSTINTSSLSQYKGGPLGIGGLLTAYFGLQLSNTVTPGASCATNGVLGTDSNGALAVCQAGIWAMTAESNTSGVCGASNGITTYTVPTSGLCTSGTATGVSGNGPWTWSCLGLNGGTNASCSATPLYVDDVFSTYLYTGNGSTQTITNGIDLAGQGGLVWIKQRNVGDGHILQDTNRGVTYNLETNSTLAQWTNPTPSNVSSFNSSGFSLGAGGAVNESGGTFASWTFRKAPKFFDVVTYTGNGSTQVISHNLGITPGMVVVKRTSGVEDWNVWHRSVTFGKFLQLNTTAAEINSSINRFGNNSTTVDPTSTQLTVGSDAGVNASGNTYVAYLFADDPDTTNGIIKCGGYTGGGGTSGPTVTLGWEPQWLIIKDSSVLNDWFVADSMRGLYVLPPSTASRSGALRPNLSTAETTEPLAYVSPTGFTLGAQVNASGENYIYCAIRRPNKPPTSASQVFFASAFNADATTNVGFVPDLVLDKTRIISNRWFLGDRLRGTGKEFDSITTAAEGTSSLAMTWDKQNLFSQSGYGSGAQSVIEYYFKRAPGVFDMVAYTGDGTEPRTITHNLGVVPEMIITRSRSDIANWEVYSSALTATKHIVLNSVNQVSTNSHHWSDTSPTASVFTVGSDSDTNGSGRTFIAYLFASKAGVSKVGSYTGNGTSQTINAGFSAGPSFVLIKRTDSTGDWYVWDATRGIVASNDPHISLNTTAAEVTTDDSIDPDNSGFIVNQNTVTNINVSGASYIYIAFASTGATPPAIGQIAYTSPGTYSWTVPSGVTSVSAVCVGAGAGGGGREDGVGGNPGSDAGNGGGGGALSYKNNISVTPGQQLAVVIGAGGAGQTGQGDGQGGGQSNFISMSNLYANGGSTSGGIGGGSGATAFSGGNGGGASGYGNGGGGGGAGGYTVVGANSACCGSRMGGGGVGLLGGTVGGQDGGLGGSGGTNGSLASNCSGGAAGSYGGGGSGGGCAQTGVGASGASGACRIIWPGDTRQFPSTNTADM